MSLGISAGIPMSTLAAQKVASCSLPIVVRATLLADENPGGRLMMIYHRDKNQSQNYTINAGLNTVMPGALIREIHKLAVIVDNRGYERAPGRRINSVSQIRANKPRVLCRRRQPLNRSRIG